MAEAAECHCHSGEYIPASIRAWFTVLRCSSSSERRLRSQWIPRTMFYILSCWFPFVGPRWFSLHCKRVRLLYFYRASWEDTDYRKGCRGVLHSTEYSYSCSVSHSTVYRERQHFLIFGLL